MERVGEGRVGVREKVGEGGGGSSFRGGQLTITGGCKVNVISK